MTPEQAAAFVIAQAACAMAEIAAMQAANQERDRRGEAAAYPEAEFMAVIEHNCISHNAVLALFEGVRR